MTLSRLPVRLLLALVGGLCLWLAFPDHDLGYLAIVGVALVGIALWDVTARVGFLLGLVAGTIAPTNLVPVSSAA